MRVPMTPRTFFMMRKNGFNERANKGDISMSKKLITGMPGLSNENFLARRRSLINVLARVISRDMELLSPQPDKAHCRRRNSQRSAEEASNPN